MLTQNEITALSLSPTKKDFVQIWNELLEVAGKLSERWDPTSTNESDPGIVLLKALTGIADKLNYNIDKNILEAFMPTAAQEDSMRKLCDMLGYNMKYYRSAETEVTIKYYNLDPDDKGSRAIASANNDHGQVLPKFTVITNSDKDISYFTTSQSSFIHPTKSPSVTVPCMEGQIVKCESSSDNNVITANQISENNRFYLPETMIAENGIFIYNVAVLGTSLADGEQWERVDNLNTHSRDARVFKFGYDSYESRPYIEFPEDYSKLFNDGIFLYYARTSGVNGNVSPRTLTQIELPTAGAWAEVKASSFNVENIIAATSGANVETIKQAYNNFKKTVGTFETLVTCRDYMNKIYSLIVNGKPLVSNILVTDIRNDLNKAVTICSCDNAGIFYKEVPLFSNTPVSENTKPVFSAGAWHLGSSTGITLPTNFVETEGFDCAKTGETFVKEGYWFIKQGNNGKETYEYKTSLPVGATEQAINHFDIVFYPYKSYSQIRSNVKDIRAVYDASFRYSEDNFGTIDQLLSTQNIKTISHNIKKPDVGDVLSINNYLRLSATIATNAKVTADEGAIIIDKIKIALANAFNMRELDFGDEIPFDSIVEVIENADTRIKVASLNEPAMYTTFSVLDRRDKDSNKPVIVEYAVASDWLDTEMTDKIDRFTKVTEDDETISTFDTVEAREIYNKLAVRNVLAGRVPLFNYNNSFTTGFSEGVYQETTVAESVPSYMDSYDIWTENGIIYTKQLDINGNEVITKTSPKYADNIITESIGEDRVNNYITDIRADCKLKADENGVITDVTLADGEFVRFRAPNFITVKTYPAYVNYHLELAGTGTATEAKAAEVESLFNILNVDLNDYSESHTKINWQKVLDYFGDLDKLQGNTSNKNSYKKTFRLEQIVSAFKETEEKPNTGTIVTLGVELENNQVEAIDYTSEQLMAWSGCVKLTNKDFKADLVWVNEDGTELSPEDSAKLGNLNDMLEVKLSEFNSPFITNINVLNAIKTAVDNALNTYRNQLPRDCAWKVSFEFECVPFEASSLREWTNFINEYTPNSITTTSARDITSWKPVDENGTILWRMFGDGYDIGKYVTKNTEKLLPFTKNYFGLLPDTRLNGIYLVKDIGSDVVPTIIKNNEEYQLKSGEHLYIEYTPSTTSEEGTSQATSAVTEIYGEGTIIRPSGFEVGLVDSDKLANSSYKEVKFLTTDRNQLSVNMHSLSASEQIEIRERAEVTITNEDFQAIYVYKNFNGCPELENENGNAAGSRTYTLKDGEAIFYTDQNKSEFAYYTSGTTVKLTGNKFTIGEFDTVELATILDSGLQEIPWERKVLKEGDSITFQEYQYITLGQEDTLNSLVVLNAEKDNDGYYLDATWKECSDVEYTLASDSDNAVPLPKISMQGNSNGNGWEASCTLELNVSPSIAQTLRKTDKVETSLTLTRTSTTGGTAEADPEDPEKTVKPIEGYSGISLPLSFKTNLACQACGNEINVKDVWSNPDNLKGFQIKVFTTDFPALVQTKPGTVTPYGYTGDIAAWVGEPLEEKEYLELWNRLDLDDIKHDEKEGCDNALRLPISLLPNTYGVFSVYVNYSTTSTNADTWIEVIPGTNTADIELLNTTNAKAEFIEGTNNKKLTKLYLNQGINCIRVNTNTKLFIKTTPGAHGSLYFDELRLVNSLPIKYTDDVTLNTKGLNIVQLGYLDSSADSQSAMMASAKEKLQEAHVEELYTKATNLVHESEKNFGDEYNKIIKLLPKVRVLVNTEKLIAKELETIKNLDEDRFKELSAKYCDVSAALDKERALLNALNGNTKADDLEAKLIDLLDSFTSIDNDQQQIISELSSLRAKAEANLKNISNEEILADFNSSPGTNGSEKEKALPKIKAEVSRMIEANYQEQLTTIANSLDNSINSASNASLVAIFEKLRNTTTAKTRAELQAKINELRNVVENDVTTLVEELVNIIYDSDSESGPDFAKFLDRLNELRATVASGGIQSLVSEIERAAEDENDIQLKTLLVPLFTSGSTVVNEGALKSLLNYEQTGLVASIDALADLARSGNSKLTTLQNDLKTFATKVSNEYITDLKAVLETLYTAVTKLLGNTDSLNSALADLQALANTEPTKDTNGKVTEESYAQAQIVIRQLQTIISERTDKLKALSGNEFHGSLKQHINAAAVAIWPAYMSTRMASLLSNIEAIFMEAFKVSASDIQIGNLTAMYSAETTIMKSLINTVSFESLFDKIKPILDAKEQTNADIGTINEISKLLLDSDDLNATIKEEEFVNINKVVQGLIVEWRSVNGIGKDEVNDVKQKQKVQAKLKEALEKAIGTQEQLFAVVSSILCPELTKALADIEALADIDETEDFYNNLISKMGNLTDDLKSSKRSNLVIADDSDYLLLLELPMSDFKTALPTFNVPEISLLPSTFSLTAATENLDAVKAQANDLETLENLHLSAFSSAELRALLVSDTTMQRYLDNLCTEVEKLEQLVLIDTSYEDAFRVLKLEDQLLSEIRAIDVNREFYYTAPISSSFAIDLNESVGAQNTLMNPQMNYDINNVNNSFVISKLDIDFLDSGIQIARSSRLN